MNPEKPSQPSDKDEVQIGEQTFQRVGKIESEKSTLKNTPKNFDLYQDVDSRALMGKLPENHPNSRLSDEVAERDFERKIESLDIDLTQLSPKQILGLFQDESIKIYGKYNEARTYQKDIEHRKDEMKVVYKGSRGGGAYIIFYKFDNTMSTRNSPFIQISPRNPDSLKVIGKNKILIKDEGYPKGLRDPDDGGDPHWVNGKAFEISFLEVPKGYKELPENKRGVVD